jgi:hypothetical protein
LDGELDDLDDFEGRLYRLRYRLRSVSRHVFLHRRADPGEGKGNRSRSALLSMTVYSPVWWLLVLAVIAFSWWLARRWLF